MHTISKFFTVLVILMVLIPSTIAAPNENANPKAGLKIVDQSKGTMKEIKDDKVKGVKSSSGDIIVDDKGKNSIKLKDSKPSKVPNEHKKVKVSIPASELQKIDVDNDGVFGVLEIADDGTIIGQRTATTAQLVAGDNFTFSEVEINGFSGYREETFAGVKSGYVLNIDDVFGKYIQTVSADGTIPTYAAINQGVASTYPQSENLFFAMSMNDSKNIVTNVAQTSTNVTYSGGNGIFNGIDSAVTGTTQMGNVSNVSIVWKGNLIAATGIVGGLAGTGYPTDLAIYVGPSNDVRYYKENTNPGANTLLAGNKTIVCTSNRTHDMVLQNGVMLRSNTATVKYYNQTYPFQVMKYYASGWKFKAGTVDMVAAYNESLTLASSQTLHAGGAGISVSQNDYNFVGYNVATGVEKIISTGGAATTLKYIDTSGGTRNVTIRTYYTQDTMKTTQSSDDDFHNMSIVHNSGVAITNGTIARQIPPLYAGTAVLESNNTNAVMSQNRTHFTIYTGTLTTSNWFGYNVSVPNNADHGMWLDTIMQWSDTISGWVFGETAPTDYTDDLSDQITVTVS